MGDLMRQVVERDGAWVGLLVGGPAALKLKDRVEEPNLASAGGLLPPFALPVEASHWIRTAHSRELHRSGVLQGHLLQSQRLGGGGNECWQQSGTPGFLRSKTAFRGVSG